MNIRKLATVASFFVVSTFTVHSAIADIAPVVRMDPVTGCVEIPGWPNNPFSSGSFFTSKCIAVPTAPAVPPSEDRKTGTYCLVPVGQFGPGPAAEVGSQCVASTKYGFIIGKIVAYDHKALEPGFPNIIIVN